MPKTYQRSRTIGMTNERSRKVALAASYLGVTGEDFIQIAISSALLTIADHDNALGRLLDKCE